MKKFLLRFLLFVPVMFIAISVKPARLLVDNNYQTKPKFNWVYTAYKQSKKKEPKAKIVVIGDSVGNQLFKVGTKQNSGPIYSLTCSAAVDIVGQYILLYNFLENNQPEAVFMINNGFKFNLNAPQVFHHFLKVFDTPENKKHFTPLARSKVRKVPFYFMSQVPHIYTTTWGPKIPFKPDQTGVLFSDLTVEYLFKMEALCKEKGVKFMVMPPPIKARRKPAFDEHLDSEIAKRGVEHMFRYYKENLKFSGAKKFRDMIHIKPKYVKDFTIEYRDKLREYAEKP